MHRKTVITAALVMAIILTLFVPLGEGAGAIHDEAFERSVGAFAIAKGLNAVISLIQGTELNATPAGVGITITVGEILDPMNDLIERFSWIMLAASVSLGIQKLLLAIGELLWLKVALTTVLAAVGASLWYRPFQRKFPLPVVLRLGIVLLLLRFAAAGFIYTEQLVYDTLMQRDYQSAITTLSDTKQELDTIADQSRQQASAKKEEGLLDSLSGSYDRMKGFFDIDARLASLKSTLDQAQKEVLNLITIFVTLNILMPLLFLWIVLSLLRWAVTGRFEREVLRSWFYLEH